MPVERSRGFVLHQKKAWLAKPFLACHRQRSQDLLLPDPAHVNCALCMLPNIGASPADLSIMNKSAKRNSITVKKRF